MAFIVSWEQCSQGVEWFADDVSTFVGCVRNSVGVGSTLIGGKNLLT